ncbi:MULTISPECIES: imidazole glycerol phosphate synthase subunit HisH [unclassified Sphingomonas]|uniref:imidazole glycerol phosphate synthase subunit HisH n=1 Tax=unclassified Sphingomonas TaxID=196159 RepID=UPI00215167AC|nr:MULTISPECIES: imidazole glycerol phosphate synthase subunit HisH [unclassified Sphingomonas]MCR5871128.1 imidazole glycerol phosphate synthase subunit HisH [Sphingomonas sp. J344]UUY00558.1 imidazole glycerol phosphate synthase subunit HisH [Sphingomonas sp. J315]
MITIVDYGLGNIGAFLNMYKRMNIPATAVSGAALLEKAERIILPGVGAFDHAMELLDASGMRPVLERKALEEKVPVVGICVGMQMLANSSEEGEGEGLGFIPGRVRRFQTNALPLPHMGWNDVVPREGEPLFAGFEEAPRFYFLHSYYFECADPADVAATANYGGDFGCVVRRDNVWGVQCHPEKSHHFGAALLRNFATL